MQVLNIGIYTSPYILSMLIITYWSNISNIFYFANKVIPDVANSDTTSDRPILILIPVPVYMLNIG